MRSIQKLSCFQCFCMKKSVLIRAIRVQNKKLSLLSQLSYNKHLQNLRYLRAKENQRLGKIKLSYTEIGCP